MSGGFVDVEIEADHQIQARDGCLQLLTVGHRQHRIARDW